MRNRKQLEGAIIFCLEHSPRMQVREICAITGMWRSSIYIHLARLEKRGVVRVDREEGIYFPRFWYSLCTPQTTHEKQ